MEFFQATYGKLSKSISLNTLTQAAGTALPPSAIIYLKRKEKKKKGKRQVRLENKNPLPRRSIERDLNSLLPTSPRSPAPSRSISMYLF